MKLKLRTKRKCPNCKTELSKAAKICPECSYNFVHTRERPRTMHVSMGNSCCLTVMLLLILFLFLLYKSPLLQSFVLLLLAVVLVLIIGVLLMVFGFAYKFMRVFKF